MFALFETELEANDFSASIHSYLLEHRAGYNAERWSTTNKHQAKDSWCVKLPIEDIDTAGLTIVEALENDWYPEVVFGE